MRSQRLKHKEAESDMLKKVSDMEKQIAEVKSMYRKRMYEIDGPFNPTNFASHNDGTFPESKSVISNSSGIDSSDTYESNVYPALPSYSSTIQLLPNDRVNPKSNPIGFNREHATETERI